MLRRLGAAIRRITSAVGAATVATLLSTPGAEGIAQQPELMPSPKVMKKPQKLLSLEDVGTLLRRMDDDRFRERQNAYRDLNENTQYFIRVLGKRPPWEAQLMPKDGSVSPEVARRLWWIRDRADAADRESFLVPTHCDLPHGAMTVRDVLTQCSREIQRPVEYFGALTKHAEEEAAAASGPLWEVIRSLRLKDGKEFVVNSVRPAGVDLTVYERGEVLTASNGNVYGSIDTKTWQLRLFLEPKAELRQWAVIQARLRKPDGSIQHAVLPREAESVSIPQAFRDTLTTDALEVEVCCAATRMHTCHVNDADRKTVLSTGRRQFLYEGIRPAPDDEHHYRASLICGPSWEDYLRRISALGEDERGNVVLTSSPILSDDRVDLRFWKEHPKRVRVFIPDDVPDHVFRRTLVFRHARV